MKLASFASSAIALALLPVLFIAGCEVDAETGDEQNVVPDSANNYWELAGLCSENITRHQGVRAQELAGGVVRWQCGDRPGVDGDDRGQEYCEYFAVNGGKVVSSVSELDASKPLQCFYRSLYKDADNTWEQITQLDKDMAKDLSKKENLGATVSPELARMKLNANSRGAAETLVKDALGVELGTNRLRQAACFIASQKNPSKAASLKKACAGIDLSKSTAWKKAQKLGVKVFAKGSADYEHMKDMEACMTVQDLQNGGVDWRMSDPHIAQVAVRANNECGCEYSGDLSVIQGFPMGTWSSENALPPGCRRAKIGGKDSNLYTICEVSPGQRSDLETSLDYQDNLSAYCNDTFGKDIVMTAPLRAIEVPGSCKVKDGAFCSEFTKTAK